MSLSDALKGVTDNVVDTVVHYVPVSPTPGPPSLKVDLVEGDVGHPRSRFFQPRGDPSPIFNTQNLHTD